MRLRFDPVLFVCQCFRRGALRPDPGPGGVLREGCQQGDPAGAAGRQLPAPEWHRASGPEGKTPTSSFLRVHQLQKHLNNKKTNKQNRTASRSHSFDDVMETLVSDTCFRTKQLCFCPPPAGEHPVLQSGRRL